MKRLIILLIATALIFQSCENKKDIHSTDRIKIISKDSVIKKNEKEISTSTNLFKNIPLKNFPIIDSTNFDNFEKIGIPDNGIIKQLKLKTKKEDLKNFRINYKIPFSENFTTITITYQSGDHELFTSLITVNTKCEIIDMLEIAYDEIAESAFQKTSRIDKDKIIVTNWNWMSGEPITENETYTLQNNGKLKEIK
ncbi:hypothetical protein [Flavobacterium frigoris]|uniref:Lipoprotein n=1 Tax=Flavobacterium frigoris TaxID=229204 RepID=A0A1H9SC35_FLAFI|nr:hypothetical protein [Flavobacterium frigoris]SER81933.1 hypothetical protein SAMN05444355_1571 [Flavobacterium frigoris]